MNHIYLDKLILSFLNKFSVIITVVVAFFISGATLADSGLDQRPDNTTCVAPERLVDDELVTSEPVFSRLRFTDGMQMLQPPNNSSIWLVVERIGRVLAFDNNENVSTTSLFLDIIDRVNNSVNGGMQSMAFHPNYPADGRIFVSYTADSGNSALPIAYRLSSFTSSDSGITFDPASEKIILSADVRDANHAWGTVGFGPDGLLYIGMGANVSSDAQNTDNFHGSIARINVNGAFPYTIPPDNPFASGGGAAEIFAWGFRNPFRWSFDDEGNLWVGDVGGELFEEINIVVKGGNYGWPKQEGNLCKVDSCDNFINPISSYAHDGNPAAVLGGLVYKGTRFPVLRGKHIFTDIANGTTRAITLNTDGTASTEIISRSTSGVRHYTQDQFGEVYGMQSWRIVRLVAPDISNLGSFPDRVSKIGCFLQGNPSLPGSALIPYDLNVPFWSDGAGKDRWFALPENGVIHINQDGDFDFPNGSLLFKNFHLGGKLIETRMIVRHLDGEWAGYSYEWDDAETDGLLVSVSGKEKIIGNQLYTYPGRVQCLQCHTPAAGHSLGLEISQLNRSIEYPSTGLTGNQLETYEHILLFDTSLSVPPENLPALPRTIDSTMGINERARAYLHSNCSQCHRPGGPGGGGLDFRFTTPIQDVGVVNADPGSGNLGVDGAKLVKPGDPSHSVVPLRMRALHESRMPPLGSNVMDAGGVALLEQWISSLDGATHAPSVVIGKPVVDSIFFDGNNIQIEAAVAVSSGTISRVEFFANDIKIGEATAPPYNYNWVSPSIGNYALTATAHDNNQLVGKSTDIFVSVNEIPNKPASVNIKSPRVDTIFTLGDNVLIEVNTDDTDGDVMKVEFFSNGLSIGQDNTVPYTQIWPSPSQGSYELTAVATDDDGAETVSSIVPITINDGSTRTVLLQDDFQEYAGTADTYIAYMAQQPFFGAHNFGDEPDLKDSRPTFWGSIENGILTRFAVFESEGGLIPDNANIRSATFSIYKYTFYTGIYDLYTVKIPWNELEVTWNEVQLDIPWEVPGALGLGADISEEPVSSSSIGWEAGWLRFDVKNTLQSWSAAQAQNYGWRLKVSSDGEWHRRFFRSSEYSDIVLRPELRVTYDLELLDDVDSDGISDDADNCVNESNPTQLDTDNDGYGNLCDGDLNNDGETNTLDLNLYKLSHRTTAGEVKYNVNADFNGDNKINTLDLNIYKLLHRRPPGPSCCGLVN